MKSVVTTLVIVVFSLVGNFNKASGKDPFHKKIEINSAGQIMRTTVYSKKKGNSLALSKQIDNKYDKNGNLSERTLSEWNTKKERWDLWKKYKFNYTPDGYLLMLSYSTYNKSNNKWKEEIKHAIYIYNTQGKLSSVHYFNIEDKENNILAANLSVK